MLLVLCRITTSLLAPAGHTYKGGAYNTECALRHVIFVVPSSVRMRALA